MKKEEPLVMRIYHDSAFTDLACAVGYVGFPVRELAERVRPLTAQHGTAKISEALHALTTFEGNRVMLGAQVRPRCGMLLGPPPEKQLDFWQDVKPECRPKGWDEVPEIPKGGPDPLMESLYRLGPGDLNVRYCDARRKGDPGEIVAVESELLRRGMEKPVCQEAPPKKPTRKKEPPPEQNGYAHTAQQCNERSLCVLLREARRKLKHHGKRSFMGKEAKKEIAAAEAEFRSRGLEIPAEGLETARWQKEG